MNLLTYKYEETPEAGRLFPAVKTDKVLLAEAKARGFYNGYGKYNELFNALFHKGGKVQFKSGLTKEQITPLWNYCRAFMKSWEPKHEEKEAICAMIMSEILEPELATA
jgi:hypothetical protein